MALIPALLPAALALHWYVDDQGQAQAVSEALTEIWPSSPVSVQVGPPEPTDPEGAVWWDGEALRMARGEQDWRAAGVADAGVQVAMVRGWLAREAPVADAPPPPEEPESAPSPPPPTRRPLLLQVGAGPALRLPQPVAGQQVSLIIGGRRRHLEAGTLLTLGAGERARSTDGELYNQDRIELEGLLGARWGLGETGDLWAFASGGSRQSLAWVPGTLDLGDRADTLGTATAFVSGLGMQVTGVVGGQEVGARLRVSTTLGAPDEIAVGEGSTPYHPGLVALELLIGLGGRS